ncbi:unnamed protein product [Rhizoctonia solani]|uniref:IBR domain-containing protein n=1 Tax=Rhizoctonia solani TaxID=456999 RepID=A0A8H3B2V5_9AGAM|nr:unnamed protein product [Rhizoctonia solani]
MSYYTSSHDRRGGVLNSMEGVPLSSYYHLPIPTVAATRSVQMDRYHEPRPLGYSSGADIERWGDSASKSRYEYLTGIRRSALESLRSVQVASTHRNKRIDEQASAEYMRVHTKPCPSCAAPIVKFGDGCDHMKCAPPGGCGFEL